MTAAVIQDQGRDMAIAQTIADQMGGAGKLRAFVGAELTAQPNGLAITFKGSRKANKLSIVLAEDDTYTLKFYKTQKPKKATFRDGDSWEDYMAMFDAEYAVVEPKLIAEFDGVYCDMLIEIFESQTGLFLHF
jgi:hypothetical protein